MQPITYANANAVIVNLLSTLLYCGGQHAVEGKEMDHNFFPGFALGVATISMATRNDEKWECLYITLPLYPIMEFRILNYLKCIELESEAIPNQ